MGRKVNRMDYQQFSDFDFSHLGKREREFLKARIDYPDLTISQLADMHGVRYGTFAGTLSNAVKKLNGGYVPQKKYYEKNKNHYKEIKQRWWENHREIMIERQSEYNKVYYQQNREKLLERARSRYANEMDEMAAAMKTIEEYRQSSGLTPEQFSEMFDVPLKTVKNWYSGKRRNLPTWVRKQIIERLI